MIPRISHSRFSRENRHRTSLSSAIARAISVGIVIVILSLATASAGAQGGSTIEFLGVDAVIEGNEATSVGELDGCVEAEVGSEVVVDVIVDEIPEDRPMAGFQYNLGYDPGILEVKDFDFDLLLAAEGSFQPIEGLSDELPDKDGSFVTAVADIASNADVEPVNMEVGAGVLTRYTLMALAAGTSEVGIDFTSGDLDYPTIISIDNEPTQVDNIGSIIVSVGEPCPADVEPTTTALPSLAELYPSPTLVPVVDPADLPAAEGGGIDYTLLSLAIAIGVGGLLVVAVGGLIYRRASKR
jgi:hypothetical protein